MSEENLNGSGQNGSSAKGSNEEKVNSVKKMIQNLKVQLEQEKALRQEEQRALKEEQEKTGEQRKEILQLQDVISQLNDSKSAIELRNEALNQKIEGLNQVNPKQKNKGGGIFTNIFSGSQKKLESLEQQLHQYEEELTIKSEEAESLHENLYVLKKEYNSNIESLNLNLDEQSQKINAQAEQIHALQKREAECLKAIDNLTETKKNLEKEIEAVKKESKQAKQLFISETLSFSRVIAIQKELLEIQIPSIKKHNAIYEQFQMSDLPSQQQQHSSFKEKEREVFKAFNWQRECVKKQLFNILNVLEQKAITLEQNLNACGQNESQQQLKEAISRFLINLAMLKLVFQSIFSVLDKIVSFEYQISVAKQGQHTNTIESMELKEKQEAEKFSLIEKLNESKSCFTQFWSSLSSFLREEHLYFIEDGESDIQELELAIEEGQTLVDEFLSAFQIHVAFNASELKQYAHLKDLAQNKEESFQKLSQCIQKTFSQLNAIFNKVKIISGQQIQFLQLTLQQQSSLILPNQFSAAQLLSFTSPKALINQNETLCISLDGFKVALLFSSEFFMNYLTEFSLKESFILENYKQLDILRAVEDYITRIGKTVELQCVLSESTLISEMSRRIADYSAQIKSLQTAVQTSNDTMRELIKSKADAQIKLNQITKSLSDCIQNQTVTLSSSSSLSSLNLQTAASSPSTSQYIELSVLKNCISGINDKIGFKVNMNKTKKPSPQDSIIDETKLQKEIAPNLADEKVRALQVFEKSRDKILTLINQNTQLERRQKETIKKQEEKDIKLKKCLEENAEQKLMIDKLKSLCSPQNIGSNGITGTGSQ